MSGGEFVAWATAFCVGIMLFVALSERAIYVQRGQRHVRDPWSWILILWIIGFPFVWVASVT